jgi:hypothetical protein
MRKYITPEQYETAERNGINKKALENRYHFLGWSIERAITEPLKDYDSRWRRIAEKNGIPGGTYYNRISRGWSKERAATQKLLKYTTNKTEFAIYKGDQLIMVGTALECARELDIKVATVKFLATRSHRKRINEETSTFAVRLDDEEDEEIDIESPENKWF